MTVAALYAYARRRGHSVYQRNMVHMSSLSVLMEDGSCVIGIDRRRMTEAQERTQLSHEIGHCETGSFYSRYTKVDSRQRHENRADKWAIRKLITEDDLDNAVAEGHTELWELAEHFGVTEDFMRKAVCLYTHGNVAAELYF